MKSVARFSLWFIGVCVAILPVAVLVASTKNSLFALIDYAAYDKVRRDFAFAVLAVLILGFVDTGEVMIGCKNVPAYDALFFAMWPLMALHILSIVVFAILCGGSGAGQAVTSAMFYGSYFSALLALLGRLALLITP